MKKIVFFFLALFPLVVFSQINDDFEDGNIDGWTESASGHWAASSVSPINGTYSLHHDYNNPDAGTDQISIPFGSFDINSETTTWRFQVKYTYAPTNFNTWVYFLFSDQDASQMNPSGTANGYAIGVDYSGTDDIIKIWRIASGSGTEILNTGVNWETEIGTSTAAGFEIKRTTSGEWSIFLDNNGGYDNLQQIGTTVTDIQYNTTNFIGVYYKYTSAQDLKLWIDDVYMGSEILDTEPPFITEIEAVSNNTILVRFNEDLDETTAVTTANYTVNNSIGTPQTAVLNPSDSKEVELTFTNTFTDEVVYTLDVNNVEDLSGNPCVSETGDFSYMQIAVTSVIPISLTELDVFFNKDVNIASGETTGNYFINGGIGNPQTATVDAGDNSIVHLIFSTEFILDQLYTISIQNVEDDYGNIITPTNLDFSYYEVQAFDVVINEIMCDVNPEPAFLPVYEYVEIYNNSSHDFNLNNWTFKIGDNIERPMPSVNLPAGEYAIICEAVAESAFSSYGITVPILNASELTVSGKRLLIKNTEGSIIEDLTYSDSWYDDDVKDNGGWSLERIDPLNFCGEDDNWTASEDLSGGTPGRENSVYGVNPDLSQPFVVSIEYISSKQINIHFSENTDPTTSENITNYLLNSSVNPQSAILSPETNSIVFLKFADNFPEGNNSISIENIEDNCGNIMTSYSGSFDYQLINPISVDVVSANQLEIYFSENVNKTSAENTAYYNVNNGVGIPNTAKVGNSDSSVVLLTFSVDFIQEQPYLLKVDSVQDINGNKMDSTEINFVHYVPKPFDIVFTEIMADINPTPVGLPDYRYIELFNTTNFEISMTGWIFLPEGQSEKEFPRVKINPHEYIILCEENAENEFLTHGKTVPILGSSDITVSGKNLKLMNENNDIINEINYSDEWYDDNDYDDGGWSLEIIDPYNFCGEDDNWTVTEDNSGGTPGRQNSVYGSNPDNTAPELLNVNIVASNYLLLEFDENISYESGKNTANFTVDNGISNPVNSYTDPSNRKFVHLQFSTQFQDEQGYELMIENIKDNCDNTMQTTGYEFTYQRIYPVKLSVEDEKNLKIKFSEGVDFETGTDELNYLCNNGIGNPSYAFRETADSSVVHIQFDESFPNGEPMTLSIQNVEDINGNIMKDAELSFTYYVPIWNDLVINEVLFNPYKDGNDFVEIYNRSVYDIDLKNIQLATRDKNDSIISYSPLSDTEFLIQPQTYMAFTTNRDSVLRDYMSLNEVNLININDIPSFSDAEGTVILIHKNDSIIDEFNYNEDMHFALLDDVEGVSLERVNFNNETQDPSNWHSASEYVGFATPAYQNSQYTDFDEPGNDPVYIDPHVFSPDNDGFDDYANIHYQFNEPGFVATVIIFDSKGRIVEQLVNNMTLSTKGIFVWDGLDANNQIAPAGTYLVYFKVFNMGGTVQLYKKTVILAKRI